MPGTDWCAWHRAYDDSRSALGQRLLVVRRLVGDVLDSRDDSELRVLSICAGDGRDLLEVIARRRARRITARLVEQDEHLASTARETAEKAGLDSIEVIVGDASTTDAYASAVPADLVLVCGVFGNVSDADVASTVRTLPELCARRASVIWTRHRRAPDLTPQIRDWFRQSGFAERAFESPGSGSWSVGRHELRGAPLPLRTGERLFTFLR